VWVGIVAGLMFIVALVFFSGFFIGRNSYGNFRGGYHQPGMMGPSQQSGAACRGAPWWAKIRLWSPVVVALSTAR
jgi:hypothetical protein